MSQQPPSLSTFARYDLLRRKRLLQVLLPILIVAIILASFDYIVRLLVSTPDQLLFNLLSSSFIFIIFFGFIWGLFALRRESITIASALMVTAGCIGLLGVFVRHILNQGLDPTALIELLILPSILVLTSLFGNIRLLVVVTILINVITASMIVLAGITHPETDVFLIAHASNVFAIPLAILFEWLIAIFLLAQQSSYQGVLRDLGQAFERLEQLDELKDQFIAHVNHELRNPVMTMRGSVELVAKAGERLTEKEREEVLNKALRVGDGLSHLLESILEVRAIDRGGVSEIQPVSVRQMLDDALLLVNPVGNELIQRDLHIHIPDDLNVMADPIPLQQILTNLISNALKYTPAGTPVDITAHLAPPVPATKRGGTPTEIIEILVRDYGPGIPPDQIPLLFHRFVRLPRDMGSSVTGTGLGLYLCQRFAEAMGGRIWVESTGVVGEGATFHLQLTRATGKLPATLFATLLSQNSSSS